MPAELMTGENLVALLTLSALEIVLGIDNIIFIAILTGRLPKEDRPRARRLGIALAVISRIVLLFSVTWIMQLTEPLLTLPGASGGLSGRDLILLVGGVFLIGKSTHEIHNKLEGDEHGGHVGPPAASFAAVIAQIMVVDVVFSLDSVITAVGISGELWVMVPAVMSAAVVMVVFAGPVSRFVEEHPTMKILALAFLILIGTLLVIEGWNPELAHEYHLKNYAYFAMAFSVAVEFINLQLRRPREPVRLHNQPTLPEEDR